MHLLSDNKITSNKKIFLYEINSIILAYKAQEDLREDLKVLKVKTEIITDNYLIVGQMTPLDIVFIAL